MLLLMMDFLFPAQDPNFALIAGALLSGMIVCYRVTTRVKKSPELNSLPKKLASAFGSMAFIGLTGIWLKTLTEQGASTAGIAFIFLPIYVLLTAAYGYVMGWVVNEVWRWNQKTKTDVQFRSARMRVAILGVLFTIGLLTHLYLTDRDGKLLEAIDGSTSSAELEQWSKNSTVTSNPYVLAAVARNRATPPATLLALSTNPELPVRIDLAQNPNLPCEAIPPLLKWGRYAEHHFIESTITRCASVWTPLTQHDNHFGP
ncbi:MAG: hypothetical protein EOP09_01160 [Proteobacteria bacterium]|nr:MAG: hypothetical protein EOP09_01160 [Pseudomonadota bacterium]